jgi:hypothetical protein
LAATGQFGFSQDAPLAFFETVARSSFSASKKARQLSSTEDGSASCRAWSCSM